MVIDAFDNYFVIDRYLVRGPDGCYWRQWPCIQYLPNGDWVVDIMEAMRWIMLYKRGEDFWKEKPVDHLVLIEW